MKTPLIFILVLLFFSMGCQAQSPDLSEDDLPLYEHLKSIAHSGEKEELLMKIKDQVGDRKLVLLGESTHGTREYYRNRYLISRMLIEEKGFDFIGVEGDWSSIFTLNQYVKNLPGAPESARAAMKKFNRWPEWMWANTEVEEMIEWLRSHNDPLPADEKVGFYGIDIYGQWDALDGLMKLISETDWSDKDQLTGKISCFKDFHGNEWDYATQVAQGRIQPCGDDLKQLLDLLKPRLKEMEDDYTAIRMLQKTHVLIRAEDHFRLSPINRVDSWNTRVDHFWKTSERLLQFYGSDSRGVVWAHNTHVGDAEATVMSTQGQRNIGKISRQKLGPQNVYILGFGTYKGRVNAGRSWGEPMQIMDIPPAIENSYENILNEIPGEDYILFFSSEEREATPLLSARGNRAIGVTYDPANERGNYVPTLIAHRYDAFWFITVTNPLEVIGN